MSALVGSDALPFDILMFPTLAEKDRAKRDVSTKNKKLRKSINYCFVYHEVDGIEALKLTTT